MFALIRVWHRQRRPWDLASRVNIDWFNPFGLNFGAVLAPGLLAAIFIYWGWDTAVSINEETADPSKTPGRAAII